MADRSSYMAKSAPGAAVTGAGDLVGEIISGRASVDRLDEDKFDSRLQEMPAEERKELIAQKVEERQRIQAELNELVAKRDAVVADKLKELEGSEGSLELNAFEVLEKQAADKGYKFEEKR
jgi:hypothetical protein